MDATEAADAVELGIRSLLSGLRPHAGHHTTNHRTASQRVRRNP
jgi:hypothetical protein